MRSSDAAAPSVRKHRCCSRPAPFGFRPVEISSRRTGKHRQRPRSPFESMSPQALQLLPGRLEQFGHPAPSDRRKRVERSGLAKPGIGGTEQPSSDPEHKGASPGHERRIQLRIEHSRPARLQLRQLSSTDAHWPQMPGDGLQPRLGRRWM